MRFRMRALFLVLWGALFATSTSKSFSQDPATAAGGVHASLGTVTSLEDWGIRRASIRRNLEVVMGPLPDRSRLAPVEFQVLDEVADEVALGQGLVRRKIEYTTEVGQAGRVDVRVRAYLFEPTQKSSEARPAILCLHQTVGIGKEEPSGMGGSGNLHYALELAQRGYVTLAPDYPSFGEYEYDFRSNPRWASGSMKAIWDNMRAIDLLERLPGVDAARIGCIGHSLGGHNTIFTSFFDERIKAAVSSCGFTRFGKYYGGNLRGWTSDRYMPRIASMYSNDPRLVPFDFPELIAGLAPRAFFTSSPIGDDNFEVGGVRDSIEESSKVYRLYGVPERLVAIYPESAHDFPTAARQEAYRFFDQMLSLRPSLRN